MPAPLPASISGRCADCGRALRELPVGGCCRACVRAQDTHLQRRDPWSRALAGLRQRSR